MQYNVMVIHTACKTLPHSQNMLTALEKIGTDINKNCTKNNRGKRKGYTQKKKNQILFSFFLFFWGGEGERGCGDVKNYN